MPHHRRAALALDSHAVDTRRVPSLSFAPPEPPRTAHISLVPAGSASATPSHATTGGLLGGMSEYPVQITKVQAPPLRDETLARDRLLEWLSVKIHRRAVLILAEAGYGKTTLLADFTRRTRVRVLWYRLDAGDRDWVGFLAYLVAAIRLHLPNFGGGTTSLLRETATSAPPREVVVDTFLRELGELASDATALVFDDFHLVDDSPDVRYVVRELLARGPERLTLVFASRREPPLRLARLRALGEVAALGTDDLRFDADETERLFRETYEMRLEPSLVAELTRRTEGWAASLQLVRTAIHDRDPTQVRAFISSLSGAEGHLYDYLAEEVVGDLDPELQAFLMRSSLLETVDLPLGTVAAGVAEADAARWIDEGERLGLLGKGGPNTRHVARAHPLVRDFLQARLERAIGADQVRDIHHRIAAAAERIDWQTAARHHLAAGDADSAERVLTGAVESILATGAYAAAEALASGLPSGELPGSAGLVIRSRLAQQRASTDEGLELAERAWSSDPTSTAALLNLVTARSLAGDVVGALDAGRKLERSGRPRLAEIGRTYRLIVEASTDGSLEVAAAALERMANALRGAAESHFLGVALCNYAQVLLPMGSPTSALASAEEAIALLAESSRGVELVSSRLARATALAHLGRLQEAREEIARAAETAPDGQAVEVASEAAEIEEYYGDVRHAITHLNDVERRVEDDRSERDRARLAMAVAHAHSGELDSARRILDGVAVGAMRTTPAFELRRRLAYALIACLRADPDATEAARDARVLAAKQGARLWVSYASVLEGAAQGGAALSHAVERVSREDPAILTMCAEVLVPQFGAITPEGVRAVEDAAAHTPTRWRPAARVGLTSRSPSDRLASATLLERIGEASDVALLREAAKSIRDSRASGLGRELARRLAAPVLIDDLGRVRIHVGERVVEGGGVRRKVLALLCLLLTKPKFSCSRDEVLDSLWPDQDPSAALNSLNQTVYFLRRVFEPDYLEDVSPGYVQQDGETIWLDEELVDCRSRRCLSLVRESAAVPTPEAALTLANEYVGRFALDFAYDEWAQPFRDALHAGFLRTLERAIRADIDSGHWERGTFLAERAGEVDPDSEELQLALVRLYGYSGAHAAAAEAYAHYARAMHELGLEPPTLREIESIR
jgi:ATP/maltotriose-dependent transcriptional regulator MalT/DNA-binding SARP family transcriptional activator